MAQITLYCEDTASLKLGPGPTGDTGKSVPGQVIVFVNGFATFDESKFPKWQEWRYAPGTPTLILVDGDAGEATSAEGAVPCPVCGKLTKSEFGLQSHLRTHVPKAAAAAKG